MPSSGPSSGMRRAMKPPISGNRTGVALMSICSSSTAWPITAREVISAISVVASDTGAKGKKVQALKLEGVHLCCGRCVTAVDKAVKSVAGVKEHTAKKNAESFEVTGDFNDKEVFDALQKAGLTGKVAK